MERLNTGWRQVAPASVMRVPAVDEIDRETLYKIARNAKVALGMRPALAYVLEALIGFYGGETYGGRVIVWPSNATLVDRTRLQERAVRYAIADLVRLGLITNKDSSNGKRYAVRSKSGQIIDAYGFDLSPLLARRVELESRIAVLEREKKARNQMHTEITICRRSVQEIIQALIAWETPVDDLQRAFEHECSQTPRRDRRAFPDASLTRWRALKELAEDRYIAASAGSSCRHKETDNETPDQSCSNGQGDSVKATPAPISVIDLLTACPNVMANYVDRPITQMSHLVSIAKELRGRILGAHSSAWMEAHMALGPIGAAAIVFVVLELSFQQDLSNPGGFFRSYVRRVITGDIDLVEAIRGMRRRRAH